MYLFQEKDKVKIPVKCKLCLKEITFEVDVEEYRQAKNFPIIKESIHGQPKHKLIVEINKNLEVDNFKVVDMYEEESTQLPEELINDALRNLGLTDEEIELYFLTTGRNAVSLGEMSLLIGKSKDECKEIANKFVDKGLFKEIIGATPHYSPLPPYAALIKQLNNFHNYISEIKQNMPKLVDKSFTEFETSAENKTKLKETGEIIQNLQKEVLGKVDLDGESSKATIKGIPKEIGDFNEYTSRILEAQINEMKDQFEIINEKSTEIIQAQVDGLRSQLDNMKTIISENMKKLRLGLLEQTIGKSVEKVISSSMQEIQEDLDIQLSVNEMVFTEELNDAITKFNQEFVESLKSTIEETLSELDGMSLDVKYDQKEVFKDLESKFQEALQGAREKVNEVYKDFFQSFGSIKELFTDSVVSKVETTLNSIMERLNMQEKITEHFWEQAKKKSTFTMQDVWFIHSQEAAKAHINEEISRAKLRVLIVAPEITDIDISAIETCPSHVNIRITALIDKSMPSHKRMIDKLSEFTNVDFRNRKLQNLWGINRDYEEVVLCVLSRIEIGNKERTEIAGIGSIIEEHIKIFVPILEDAWMGGTKISKTKTSTHPTQKPTQKDKEEKKTEKKTLPQVKELPKEKGKSLEQEVPKRPSPQTSKTSQETSIDMEGLPILEQLKMILENIIENIDTMSRETISNELEKFYKRYIQNIGFNEVAKKIHKKSMILSSKDEELTEKERRDLASVLKRWDESF
ncbi:MAG: hypothetical protein EU547_04700 [Promethearchaeota archaeon]|nr:MAG: hypothetical protein EU547_04700 [Candidatus Lokiarchaeota archaeon]